MSYLLDTNIIIDELRGKSKVNLKLVEKDLFISVITEAELLYGVYKSSNKSDNLQIVKNFISGLEIRVIEVDSSIVDIFVQRKIDLEKKGEKIEDFDILIAATALDRDMILVTFNKKHFKRIKGLKMLD